MNNVSRFRLVASFRGVTPTTLAIRTLAVRTTLPMAINASMEKVYVQLILTVLVCQLARTAAVLGVWESLVMMFLKICKSAVGYSSY